MDRSSGKLCLSSSSLKPGKSCLLQAMLCSLDVTLAALHDIFLVEKIWILIICSAYVCAEDCKRHDDPFDRF